MYYAATLLASGVRQIKESYTKHWYAILSEVSINYGRLGNFKTFCWPDIGNCYHWFPMIHLIWSASY